MGLRAGPIAVLGMQGKSDKNIDQTLSAFRVGDWQEQGVRGSQNFGNRCEEWCNEYVVGVVQLLEAD